jgi:hypothetical protein
MGAAAWEPECLFGRKGGETVTQTDQGGATSHPLWQLDAVPAAPAWQDAAPVPEYGFRIYFLICKHRQTVDPCCSPRFPSFFSTGAAPRLITPAVPVEVGLTHE